MPVLRTVIGPRPRGITEYGKSGVSTLPISGCASPVTLVFYTLGRHQTVSVLHLPISDLTLSHLLKWLPFSLKSIHSLRLSSRVISENLRWRYPASMLYKHQPWRAGPDFVNCSEMLTSFAQLVTLHLWGQWAPFDQIPWGQNLYFWHSTVVFSIVPGLR